MQHGDGKATNRLVAISFDRARFLYQFVILIHSRKAGLIVFFFFMYLRVPCVECRERNHVLVGIVNKDNEAITSIG